MVSTVFETWVKQLDRSMVANGRKIVLMVDNCTAHCNIDNLMAIKLVFLPPNTTSVIQPLDQGIIKNFKAHYRKLVLKDIIRHMDLHGTKPADKLNVLQAMRYVESAWNLVKPDTIANCFRHGLLNSPDESEDAAREQRSDALVIQEMLDQVGSSVTSGKLYKINAHQMKGDVCLIS